MHMMWRGLELPGRVYRDENVSNESYARFVIEPFEQGFGTTIGNSLRRVLLSSLEGAAITTARIEGVSHEFSSMEGVLEDVTEILLNIKEVVVAYDGEEPKTITLRRDTSGEMRAGELLTDASVQIGNPDHLIATLTADVPFHAEFTVQAGRGYSMASEHRAEEEEIGIIPIDSVFSPVRRVRYRTEDMRVGQKTNYDRLILEVWTNGMLLPEDALVEAGMILRKHLTPFVMYDQFGSNEVTPAQPIKADADHEIEGEIEGQLDKPISVLNLSVRAANCLEAAKISKLRDLVGHTENEMLRFRSFGKTSLDEVVHKLADMGLTLGMLKCGEDHGAMTYGSGPFEESGGISGQLGVGFVQGTAFTEPPGSSEEGQPDSPGSSLESSSGDAGSGDSGSTDSSSPAQGGPMAAFTMDD